jgi:hypothetical protein
MPDMTDTMSKNDASQDCPARRRLLGVTMFWVIVLAIIACRVVYFDQVAASNPAPQAQISAR